MRKFGLIGFPLGHSFSRKYFSEKFINENISDCSYENYPIPYVEELPELIAKENLSGINVTIPYKSEVFKFLDVIDPEAAEIGAVNVIKIIRDGSEICLKGFNSDITGILDTLQPYSEMSPRSALVLGTGGSSKAVCHVLGKLGFTFKVVSRKPAKDFIIYPDLTKDILDHTGLIVNTTPLGMYPDIGSKPPIDYNALKDSHVLFDLIYNPELTSFLREGKERGAIIISGLKMLHSQAERSWEIWNNPEF